MASLERRGNKFRLTFRYAGKKYQHPLRTNSEREANACVERVEENIRLLERGRLLLPEEADLPTFLLSDGKLNEAPVPRTKLKLGEFRDRYMETHSQGSLEEKTLQTIRTHFLHLVESLGESFDVQSLTMIKLQEHVNRRAKCTGIHKRQLSPVTTKKEIATFCAAWNWGVQAGMLTGRFPNQGLRFPKTTEKPPFRTFDEVHELVKRKNHTYAERRDLWDCVFLTLEELDELLRYVEEKYSDSVVYPMVMFAAMTGARRSEILRLRWQDIDFSSQTVVIHERKKSKGKLTTRRVPLAQSLITLLRIWQKKNVGGTFAFPACFGAGTTEKMFTQSASTELFKSVVARSKWRHLRGWHVFRHSFISNCTAKHVDQRMIDEWVGHTTEAMRRRYRHLIPGHQREAIRSVFD